MENNLEILQNIMKPYFDKKAEIENKPAELENDNVAQTDKIKEIRQERIERRKVELEKLESKLEELKNDSEEKVKSLKIELENLKVRTKISIDDFNERKEREIEEYVTKTMDSNPNLSAVYGSFVRKDLEKQYDKKLESLEAKFKQKEEELTQQINELELETDFENGLKEEIAQLHKEIKSLKSVSEEEREEKQNLEDLNNKTDFRRVDLRELVDIKENIRKQLLIEQKRLNNELNRLQIEQRIYKNSLPMELEKKQLEFNDIMYKLSNFKYEYNDQHQVINGNEWRKLYEESNMISSMIYELKQKIAEELVDSDEILNIKEALSNVDKYLEMTNLTEEEIKVVMMSMTPLEKAEYDRRKNTIKNQTEELNFENSGLNFEDKGFQKLGVDPVEDAQGDFSKLLDGLSESDKKIIAEVEEEIEKENEDVVDINDPVESNYKEKNGVIKVDSKFDLLKTVYNDIIKEVTNLRSIKINPSKEKLGKDEYYLSSKSKDEDYIVNGTVKLDESIKLPCGEYINSDDINEALDKYYDKNKGTTYVVKKSIFGKKFEINLESISLIKNNLKKCSAINLMKNKKIGKLDLVRVFTKKKVNDIEKAVEIGSLNNIQVPESDYINRNELIVTLEDLFTTKKQTWLRNISDSLKAKKQELLDETNNYESDNEEENIKQR